ncbi:MAG: RAMP superfamily CRISPR-associated protein [Neomegalonema sp.]|nr:RAMP superfamily CRISPR-associated protein [Neomegalonema sp.]
MARKLCAIYRLKGTLESLGPMHIGGMADDLGIDMTLARNGAGELYIPGTSLAGALRDWSRRTLGGETDGAAAGSDLFDYLWGNTPTRENQRPSASHLAIDDAPICAHSQIRPEIRDGVGIDRVTGTAADGIKYDREVLPAGSFFTFELRVNLTTAACKKVHLIETHLKALMNALASGQIRIGAAKTRGLGRLALLDPRLERLEWAKADVLASLVSAPAPADRGDGPGWRQIAGGEEYKPDAEAAADALTIKVHWRPCLPVMVKDGAEGSLVDQLPLMTRRRDGKLRQVIPGSSVKGVLRNHAERIWRTVTGTDAPTENTGRERFLKQLELDQVEWLFGAPARAEKTEEAKKIRRGLSAITVDDCLMPLSVDRNKWQPLFTADAEGQDRSPEATDEVASGAPLPVAMVAIDRWTGGAAEGFLYSRLEPAIPEEDQVFEITLALHRIAKDQQLTSLALLLLVLRDLARGRLAIGFGGNRGLGSIEVSKIAFEGQRVIDAVTLPEQVPDPSATGAAHWDALTKFEALGKAWSEAIEAASANTKQGDTA